jgi:hypothetical protein
LVLAIPLDHVWVIKQFAAVVRAVDGRRHCGPAR